MKISNLLGVKSYWKVEETLLWDLSCGYISKLFLGYINFIYNLRII